MRLYLVLDVPDKSFMDAIRGDSDEWISFIEEIEDSIEKDRISMSDHKEEQIEKLRESAKAVKELLRGRGLGPSKSVATRLAYCRHRYLTYNQL